MKETDGENVITMGLKPRLFLAFVLKTLTRQRYANFFSYRSPRNREKKKILQRDINANGDESRCDRLHYLKLQKQIDGILPFIYAVHFK